MIKTSKQIRSEFDDFRRILHREYVKSDNGISISAQIIIRICFYNLASKDTDRTAVY